MTLSKTIVFLSFAIVSLFSQEALSQSERTISLPTGDELTVTHFPAKGKYIILWFAPEYGFRKPHRSLAQAISQENIEVWQTNIVESLFMPQGVTSIKELDSNYTADLIDHIYKKTGKKIIIAGDSYASITALRAIHRWQSRLSKSEVVGALLFTPYTYSSIPALGHTPDYLPIISSTNIPIMIYQSKNSGVTNQFGTLVKKLQQHNNPVYTRITPNIMSLFYQKTVTKEMILQAKPLPKNISRIIKLLDSHNISSAPIKIKQQSRKANGINIKLNAFTSKISPSAINLKDTNSKNFNKENYLGRVTIINFWATWCPPCIEEIPSLNRLNNLMKGKPFDLISINYAEDSQTIKDFMKKVSVKFPVLLDSNGEYAKQWNVITYPSTFIINTKGEIVYGVNAAIEWDSPEVVDKISELFNHD